MEFALLLPIFMMLVLGMFSGGLAYNQRLQLTHAAREGARWAATQPESQSFASGTWAENVRDVTRIRADGEVPDGQICVALVTGAGMGSNTNTDFIWKGVDSGAEHPGATTGCFNDGTTDPTQKRVQVLLRLDGELEFLLGSMNLNLKGKAVSDHETTGTP